MPADNNRDWRVPVLSRRGRFAGYTPAGYMGRMLECGCAAGSSAPVRMDIDPFSMIVDGSPVIFMVTGYLCEKCGISARDAAHVEIIARLCADCGV